MIEVKAEEAKKELQGLVDNAKQSAMSAEEKKALADKALKDQEAQKVAEAQKAKDAAILAKKEEERTAEEKERAKAVQEQEKKDKEKKAADEEANLAVDEKVKRIQEKTQKKIDEVLTELNIVKDKSSREAQELKATLQELRLENEELSKKLSAPKADSVEGLAEKQEKERLTKYLEEDKDKPLTERREMSDEDLSQWLIDDYAQASRWLARQERRKEKERDADVLNLKRKNSADDFVKKQKLSMEKVNIRHPELNVAKRAQELKSQGKNETEIRSIILGENSKYRILAEIMKEPGAEKYVSSEDGPERAAEEMERRLKSTPNPGDKDKVDELTKKVEELSEELERMKNLDIGVNSTIQRSREANNKLSEAEKTLVDTMESVNAPQEAIDKALASFRKKQK